MNQINSSTFLAISTNIPSTTTHRCQDSCCLTCCCMPKNSNHLGMVRKYTKEEIPWKSSGRRCPKTSVWCIHVLFNELMNYRPLHLSQRNPESYCPLRLKRALASRACLTSQASIFPKNKCSGRYSSRSLGGCLLISTESLLHLPKVYTPQ